MRSSRRQFCFRLYGLAVLASLCPGLAGCSPAGAEPRVGAAWVKEHAVACAACHGDNGVSKVPTFPTIAGQPTSYLQHAMQAYRSGTRDNAIMNGQMRGLTDAQIQALAVYYHRYSTPLERRVD